MIKPTLNLTQGRDSVTITSKDQIPVFAFQDFGALSGAALIANFLRSGAPKVQCIFEDNLDAGGGVADLEAIMAELCEPGEVIHGHIDGMTATFQRTTK